MKRFVVIREWLVDAHDEDHARDLADNDAADVEWIEAKDG